MKTENKKLSAIIESRKSGCSIYFKDYQYISSHGINEEEAKKNFDITIKKLIRIIEEEGLMTIPTEFRSEYVIDYKLN
jgi:hypothetical protein